jgi:hypothetical protein
MLRAAELPLSNSSRGKGNRQLYGREKFARVRSFVVKNRKLHRRLQQIDRLPQGDQQPLFLAIGRLLSVTYFINRGSWDQVRHYDKISASALANVRLHDLIPSIFFRLCRTATPTKQTVSRQCTEARDNPGYRVSTRDLIRMSCKHELLTRKAHRVYREDKSIVCKVSTYSNLRVCRSRNGVVCTCGNLLRRIATCC